MVFETDRLILRPWCLEDAEELYKYAKDPRVGPRAGWPAHTSVENSREIIETVFSAEGIFAVVFKETGLPVGCIGYMQNANLPTRNDEVELGYWIGKPYWGQGLIPEASRALLQYAFESLGMRAVWCGYYEGNQKSKRVQEKLGFVYRYTTEGLEVTLVNEIRTGHTNLMTKERWQKVNLFREQKKTLDTFRQRNAISLAQYDKSLGDLRALMAMDGVD